MWETLGYIALLVITCVFFYKLYQKLKPDLERKDAWKWPEVKQRLIIGWVLPAVIAYGIYGLIGLIWPAQLSNFQYTIYHIGQDKVVVQNSTWDLRQLTENTTFGK